MKFKVLEWIREIRDKNYEKCKDMSPREKIEFMKKIAKEFTQKSPKADSTADSKG